MLILYFIDGKSFYLYNFQTITFFTSSLFPNLFFFFILSNLFSTSVFFKFFCQIFYFPLSFLLKSNSKEVHELFLLSILCGSPLYVSFIRKSKLSFTDQNHLILSFSFVSLGFIFSLVAQKYSSKLSFIIFLSILITHIMYFRFKKINYTTFEKTKKISFIQNLKRSINQSFNASITILGIMMFCNIIIFYLTSLINIPYLKGLIDVTSILNTSYNDTYIAFSISFLGLSMLLQINDSAHEIPLFKLITFKLAISLITTLLFIFLNYLI